MSLPKTKITTGFLLFTLLFTGLSRSQAQPSRFSAHKYIKNRDTLNYRFLFPDYDTFRKYPLVVFLHGAGERGNDNDAQLMWGVMNFATDQSMLSHPAFVLAPQCPEKTQWANFTANPANGDIRIAPEPSGTMSLLVQLIHEVIKQNRIDTNRIYITGLSMGGYGTFDAIMRYPDLFAAAVPVCGGGDTSKASRIAHLPIWMFHGADDVVVSPDLSANMTRALFNAGARPGFTLYPEVGHFAWLAAYSDQNMMEWLFRQHK
ncbi:MAG: prolyl oligopeptidase family serine peptidase [Chitinophagaceae bacterium]|jgi:predicted peptidase|nr:prolyl oligopeptidase family serine peptidase [Chitinophagaceae bacterium]OQY92418.1 MAG: hypothetical protein B6D37_14085 [Sphingobacteriales bacterium UTBCD1]